MSMEYIGGRSKAAREGAVEFNLNYHDMINSLNGELAFIEAQIREWESRRKVEIALAQELKGSKDIEKAREAEEAALGEIAALEQQKRALKEKIEGRKKSLN